MEAVNFIVGPVSFNFTLSQILYRSSLQECDVDLRDNVCCLCSPPRSH
jgi:hypothetical protein